MCAVPFFFLGWHGWLASVQGGGYASKEFHLDMSETPDLQRPRSSRGLI